MATTLYLDELRNYSNKIPSPGIYAQSSNSNLYINEVNPFWSGGLGPAGSSGSQQDSRFTAAGPITAPGLVLGPAGLVFISRPLASGVTISGTIAADIWASESSMSANSDVGIVLWKLTPQLIYTKIIELHSGTELGTSAAQMSMSGTPTSTVLEAGDMLVAAVYYDDATSTTMGNGYTVYFYAGGPEGSNYDSQIRFTETLSFCSDPAGSVTNLLTAPSDFSSSYKKLWTDSMSNPSYVDTTTATSPQTVMMLLNAVSGNSPYGWYTPPLEACELAGVVEINIGGVALAANSYAGVAARIYKVNSSGDWSSAESLGQARGFVQNANASYAWATMDSNYNPIIVPVKGSVFQGERLMVQFLLTASSGNMLPGITIRMYLENTSYPTKVTWPVTLTEYNATPPAHADDYWGVAC